MNAPRFPERWVGMYTRGLPPETREARLEEIASDVHDHCASSADANGRGVRAAVVGRTLRGVPGDVMWRFEEGRAVKQHRRANSDHPTGLRAAWATVTQSWFTPLAVVVGLTDIAFAIWVVLDPDGKMPGQVIGPILLVGFATAMFTGLWLRWRANLGAAPVLSVDGLRANRRSTILVFLAAVSIVAIAVVVVISGSLVALLVGGLTLVGVIVAARRGREPSPAKTVCVPERGSWGAAAQPTVLADVLIIVGTLPALALFWFIVPALFAIVVIAGVVGTGPRARRVAV